MSGGVKREMANEPGGSVGSSRQLSAISFQQPTDNSLSIRTEILRSLHTFHVSLLTILLILPGIGCDEPFQPLKGNERAPFSIFGYLDASADTQWIRLTPVREQINLSESDVPDMDITIEHLESGSTSAMDDSLILFPDGFHILNVWSATDILEPEQTYHLKAERQDGVASSVTVTFPEDFPTPLLEIYRIVDTAKLTIEDVEQLVAVQLRTRVRVVSESANWNYVRVYPLSKTDQVYQITPDRYSLILDIGDAEGYVYGMIPAPPRDDLEVEILDFQIFVASGGPEWKEEFVSLDDRNYSLPSVISNVENGTGYLFGIVSKSIPFKNCFNDQDEIVACPAEQPLQ